MRRYLCLLLTSISWLALAPSVSRAETVFVKYRGPVDLTPFRCEWVDRSAVVKRLCYDAREKYVVVNLTGVYYHYCEVPAVVVTNWRAAESMGRFYNQKVKGNFDCRVFRVPPYAKVQGVDADRVAQPGVTRARRYASNSCEAGHWVESVSDDGDIVKLEDGSVWEIDGADIVDSALWLPTSEIVACAGKLINTDDNETVSATRIK